MYTPIHLCLAFDNQARLSAIALYKILWVPSDLKSVQDAFDEERETEAPERGKGTGGT